LIELVSKVLDYFNKEKIVRIVCMLFDVSYQIFKDVLELERKQGMLGSPFNDQCFEHRNKTAK